MSVSYAAYMPQNKHIPEGEGAARPWRRPGARVDGGTAKTAQGFGETRLGAHRLKDIQHSIRVFLSVYCPILLPDDGAVFLFLALSWRDKRNDKKHRNKNR